MILNGKADMSSPSPVTVPNPLRNEIATALVGVGGSVAAAAALEWEHFRRILQWERLDLSVLDRVVLFWKLAANVFLLLVPVLLVSILAGWTRRERAARWALYSGVPLILAILAVDLRLHEITGNHLTHYVTFLATRQPLEWAGGQSMIGSTILLQVAVVAALSWIGTATCLRIASQAGTSSARLRFFYRIGAISLTATLALGAGPSPFLFREPALLERLNESLPVPFTWRATDASGDLGRFRATLHRRIADHYTAAFPNIVAGQLIDDDARVEGRSRPNVIVLVLESFRHDAIGPEFMPKLDRRADRGLRLARHYAGGNSSHLGLFSLLYGRSPVVYDVTLNAAIEPQLPATFRLSGYGTSFLSGGTLNWVRMDQFINQRTFDRVELDLEGDWPARDRRALARTLEIIGSTSATPQLVVAFLMSTHFDYQYPTEYERHKPVIADYAMDDPRLSDHREEFLNRYRNATAFLDDALSDFLERIDPERNVVVITGDHGESLWEDSTLAHSSRASDIQTRVPMVILGPGAPAGTVQVATRHADLLPTLLHVLSGRSVAIARTHGRDVLAGDFHEDAVVLSPVRFYQPQHLVLIRNQRRLRVRLWLNRPRVEAVGFFDVQDDLDYNYCPTDAESAAWGDMLAAEIARMGA